MTASLDQFAAFAAGADADLALDRGVALLSGSAQRQQHTLLGLDVLADEVLEFAPEPTLGDLVTYLQKRRGLRGNVRDYYNPENSYVDRVLETGLGIPISLSVIYIEVGRRVGIPLGGVGFPGHFLMEHLGHPHGYLDPFEPATLLDETACGELLQRLSRGRISLSPEHLRPASNRQILQRMLTNLKHVYTRSEELERAIEACDRLLLLVPQETGPLRDRGILHYQNETFVAAQRDLESYLQKRPTAPDRQRIEETLRRASERVDLLH